MSMYSQNTIGPSSEMDAASYNEKLYDIECYPTYLKC